MATLILVRHGEAEGNSDHRFIGHTQVLLTEAGRRQAETIAVRLSRLPISRIVTSDLIRCVETVSPLAERVGIEVQTDSRLREVDNGEWTGLLPEEISERWPVLWSDYVRGADVYRPSGERWQDVAARVLAAASDLLSEEGTVVVGTHSGPALIMTMWASGIEIAGNIFRGRFNALHNGSVSVIGPGPRLVSFNDVGHLASLPDQRLPFAPVR